ncbi:aspartyl-phosphate phosphatase Spo0E family protein [Metabacillus indicus]|uniref:aspartyl-phosphate phosphatase Spo0E family protein n=1 Tax=Metabacillus indicus TaxID=246786 RepID=UPI0029FFADFC|nr:aspartyl-phosphate phosphatase Spo0E family protein [Metabacillus indicus]MDX8290874.1 aspartyl-phosphate phosphatase Spo0E family protein [Metabacillus indicus]
MLNRMDMLIEKYRKKMVESAKREGLSSASTVRASQQLDRVLNLGVKLQESSWIK